MITAEDLKSKKGVKALGLALATAIALECAVLVFTGGRKDDLETKTAEPQRSGLVWIDENKREYAGIVRYFHRGADQKFYVDRKPFGSLDGIKVKAYSDNGKTYEVDERQPELGEEDTFYLLEDYAKKEHPALFGKFK